MRESTHVLGGSECVIRFPERPADLVAFDAFMRRSSRAVLALDTETTGLDIFGRDHQLRLVQIGDTREAWVLRADYFGGSIGNALLTHDKWVCHNAVYDLLVLDRHLGLDLSDTVPRTFDTRILAHLLDPRAQSEGGVGHGLKRLSEVYVDPTAPDGQRELIKVFRSIKATKDTGWALIDIDQPDYVHYAGLDVLLTRRLFDELGRMVREVGLDPLSRFEHHLAGLLAVMQKRGMLLDVPYTERLRDDLDREATTYEAVAARFGVDKVNSPKQVATALVAMGETLTETTPSGAPRVDSSVLLAFADLDHQWHRIDARDPNPLADAVLRSKRATKWASTYARSFLDMRDATDRLHPFINSLQARTARMSISNPPLQQLPSGDWTIRRAFIADPGQLMVSCDYQAVEMRVLAAMSGDETMKAAIADGLDLHAFTAERVFGADFTKQHRKIAKAVGFGKVYGGGVATIARQTGADPESVGEAIRAYDATFPGIKRYARRLQQRAEFGKKEVVTPSGRHLPLDRDRLYAATNYVVQSTARDLLAQAIVDCFDAGLGEHLLLPIHDELLAQAPAADADDFARELGRIMSSTFMGVDIATDPEVLGPSWGHGYGATS